jgi:hypothetical protein
LARIVKQLQSTEARLKRLASSIDAVVEKDREQVEYSRRVETLRKQAAVEAFQVCAGFVRSVNQLLSHSELLLAPSEFSEDSFQENGINLIQVNVQGRILQVEFQATGSLTATEDFRIPYTLQGSVRAFNQALLEKNLIEEQLLFYTLEKQRNMWRYFDARTYRSGPFDQEYLITVMEQLL